MSWSADSRFCRVRRSLKEGSAAAEKVSAAAEKRSAVAKVGAVVAERKGCGREDSTLRSRTLNPADAK